MKKFYHLRNILTTLTQDIRKQDFLLYFKKMTILEKNNNVVVFWVVSEFMKWNLMVKFYKNIKDATILEFPDITSIEFEVDSNIDNPSNEDVVNCLSFFKELNSKKKTAVQASSNWEIDVSENKELKSSKYSLANFIVWPDNQLAHSACQAVAKKPWKAYNPVYIYWDVWLWKTHLLQATWNEISRKWKDARVLYTTADKFLNEYVWAVKRRSIEKLRAKYKDCDTLIIDDVQFLENKKQTQNELYNIFNLLYDSNKQIILSWDRAPRELTELEPRLRSRFEWGITIDIWKPDFETRLAILQEKARQKEFILKQDVCEFIAANVTENVRELEWILNQLVVEFELSWMPPSLERVARKLKQLSYTDDILGQSKQMWEVKIKSFEDLLDAVSDHYGIEKELILWEKRKKEFMMPRQIAMYLLKNKMHYTYERIWTIFDWRNHASVLYSCKKLEGLLKKDKSILNEVNEIREKIGL